MTLPPTTVSGNPTHWTVNPEVWCDSKRKFAPRPHPAPEGTATKLVSCILSAKHPGKHTDGYEVWDD